MIHQYRGWVDDAYGEDDHDESIGKWQRVFGGDFAKSAALEKAASVSEAARSFTLAARGRLDEATSDLVTLFTRYGKSALPEGFDNLPHKERPKWKRVKFGLEGLVVVASLYDRRDGTKLRNVSSGDGPLDKGRWLRFSVRTADGVGLGRDLDVRWRITNTDREAQQDNGLRGGFEPSEEGLIRWEHLGYRGVHSVEAFVIRRRDGFLMGESKPFYVVVG